MSSLHQLNLLYLSEHRASATSSDIMIQVNHEVYYRVPPQIYLVFITYGPKEKALQKYFSLSYNLFVPHNFSVQLTLLNCSPSLCHHVRRVQVLFVVCLCSCLALCTVILVFISTWFYCCPTLVHVARSKVYFDFIDYYFWCEQKKRSKCLCKVKILSAPILCLAAILKENK